MSLKTRLIAAIGGVLLLGMFVPTPVLAQARVGSLTDCIEFARGDKQVFLDCVEDFRGVLQEQYKLSGGWFERLRDFLDQHPDWVQRMRVIADRLEDRWDRREDRRDIRENWRDRHEDYRDHVEDIWDRREDRHDEDLNLEDLFDRIEDRRDRREDRWDRRENRLDRRENYRDRIEDRRDGQWPLEG